MFLINVKDAKLIKINSYFKNNVKNKTLMKMRVLRLNIDSLLTQHKHVYNLRQIESLPYLSLSFLEDTLQYDQVLDHLS